MGRPYAERSARERASAQKYNNIHYSVVGCKLPRPEADAFRAYCAANGKSVSSVLAEYVRDVLRSCAGSTDASVDPESIQGEKNC